jgi:ubiquinol-cytochrome c reductase iron-sulfur subunit
MSADETDQGRRRFLTAATTVIGGIGAACAALPFLASWAPSSKARALGAPVDVDLSKIEPGQKITIPWRGKPVFVVRRTKESLQHLSLVDKFLRDPLSQESEQPQYAANPHRSIREDIFVAIGICTHLGCVPLYKPKIGDLGADWEGGFFCPCHGSKYDMAGRVYKGVPAPVNLVIPPYAFISDTQLRIGEEKEESGASA